jgi:hypothetical protein
MKTFGQTRTVVQNSEVLDMSEGVFVQCINGIHGTVYFRS